MRISNKHGLLKEFFKPNCVKYFLPFCMIVLFSGSLSAQRYEVTTHSPGRKSVRLRYENSDNGIYSFKKLIQPKIGLALSGGQLRGMAQIGVLSELQKAGINIDFIASSSIGSIIGGLYSIGYSPEQLETFALSTDWFSLFSDAPNRSSMFIGQKEDLSRHFFELRFKGVLPYIPQAISTGQQITSLLQSYIWKAGLNPYTDFDNFKIPLRVIASNMLTGQETHFSRGDLTQVIMASISMPLLFSPVKIDSSFYWDAGLVNNIPVDVARSMGSDIVIAVNTTAPLRDLSKMIYPWQHFDQGTTIMQQKRNIESLALADIVISPLINDSLEALDGNNVSIFIEAGRQKATEIIPEIYKLIDDKTQHSDDYPIFEPTSVTITGNRFLNEDYLNEIVSTKKNMFSSYRQISNDLQALFETGYLEDVSAEILESQNVFHVVYKIVENPHIETIEFTGNNACPSEEILSLYSQDEIPVLNHYTLNQFLTAIPTHYSIRGLSLARIDNLTIDRDRNRLELKISEGTIDKVNIVGNNKTRDHVIRREFTLKPGDTFDSIKAQQGISNIYSTDLFQKVYLSIEENDDFLTLIINVEEKIYEVVRFGARHDLEQETKGFIELVDDNFAGTSIKSRLHARVGERDDQFFYEIKTDRIWRSYWSFNADFHLSDRIDYLTDQNEGFSDLGDFKNRRLGLRLSLGRQLGRFGLVSMEMNVERLKLEAFPNQSFSTLNQDIIRDRTNERLDLRTFTLRSVVDTRNKYPFPKSGTYQEIYYETSGKIFRGDLSYVKFYSSLENYYTILNRSTFVSRLAFGFADETLPFSQRFFEGGQNSFFGRRENSIHGRMIATMNFSYRYEIPSRNFFNSYFTLRYDLINAAEKKQRVKFSDFTHALGVSIAVDLPLGPIQLSYGSEFGGKERIYFSFGRSF